MSRQEFNDLVQGFTVFALIICLMYGTVCLFTYNKGENLKEVYCGELHRGMYSSARITKQIFLEHTVEDGDSFREKAAIKGWNSNTCEQLAAARSKLVEKLND